MSSNTVIAGLLFLFSLASSDAFPSLVGAHTPLSLLKASRQRAVSLPVCGAVDTAVIQDFLYNGTSSASAAVSLDDFHVHGWRWHTMSLAREAERLQRLAEQPQADQQIKPAADYVVGFNLKGLHRIENDIFFPWVRDKLVSPTQPPALANAFAGVLDQLDKDRMTVSKLGETIIRNAGIAADPSQSESSRADAIRRVAADAARVADTTKSMLEIEDSFVVPAIARVVPEKEQKSFSNRVLLGLGVFDSRLHLVGMHEALADSGDEEEQRLFKKNIPTIPQKMIPRWKRKLYEPAAGVMDQ